LRQQLSSNPFFRLIPTEVRNEESCVGTLTSTGIGPMIRPMFRRILAALLIIGWVSLSGFDVVEDLDDISRQTVLSSASPDDSSSKVRGWGPLANNIIESANRIQQDSGTLVSFTASSFNHYQLLDLRRQLQLHKLYCVFLI
jgi:hypothetical protein